MGIRIITMTNAHPDFYRLVGPLLGNREIARELGMGNVAQGIIWNDEGKEWFLAMDGDALTGFATMHHLSDKKKIVFDEAYVFPSYREQRVHSRLIDERLASCAKGSLVQVIACTSSRHQYESRGFAVKRARGKDYVEMTKEIGEI